MYKTQLRRWKLFKNNRAADVAAILRLQGRRNAINKGSNVLRNGRRVDTETYLRRKGLSIDDLLRLAPTASSSGGSLPLHLHCTTPTMPRPPSPMQGVLLLGLATPGLGIKEVVGSWVLRECERLEEQMGMAMVIDSGIDCESTVQDRPLLSYCDSTASKLTADYYSAIWLLQKSQSEGFVLAHTVFERLETLLHDCENLLYPILNLLIIILALPSGDETATSAVTADIHRQLWEYLSSHARIRLASGHPVHYVLGQLSELFSQRCSGHGTGGDYGDDKYDLLYSVVSDTVNMLGSRKDESPSGSQTMYHDLVTLWYGETLQSHRCHRQRGYQPRYHLADDQKFAILNPGRAAGASAASSSSSSPQWFGTPDSVDPPFLDPNSMDLDFDLGLAAINSYLLLDIGWQTAWRDHAVYDACAALLQAKEYTGAWRDETDVNCLTAMALYERAHCGAAN
ncbi:hypothetical protein G7054_g13500 [Neopestalotiopsis clavispora]|nr:hypothetical protein G7054_g13500 [Neopestalotiopsis clavispora]